ncbi:(2,3-dihydroxybenzoyl)adenylate synthase [Tahibacter amnicola]|uniref:(2,3-dihydroxybenzoyl)adenylate synthase n=1 Tax=Tahibacter amnicola TaxID=2976241 RepID=A0ABY6B9T2_9GAMM|nr:(2,3-dihydroxybenzoyl)adenylate synthase [Tahibacter amnicola]UXI66615.1 (2,3-dihydroxybenzoyl)adenylate synthase [Tahibacter amnicola]
MNSTLLPGFTPWPAELAAQYRRNGCWAGQTLSAAFREAAMRTPDAVALVCGERRWRYGELQADIDALAGGLHALGLRARDRIVVQLPNIAEFLLVCFAAFRIGVIPVMALPAHRRSEIRHFLQISQACAWIVADQDAGFDYRNLARELTPQTPDLRHLIVVGDAQEFIALDSLYRPTEPLPQEPPADAVALLQISGGTTGLPKLIPRTHDDYLYSIRTASAICDLHPDSVYLCTLPAAHNFPMSSPGTFGALCAGSRVVMARRPSPDVVFPLIAREGVSITAVVPPLAMAWLDAAARNTHDLSTLALLQVGGAKLGEEVARRIRPVLGCRLQQVFGMAEGLVNFTRHDDSDDVVAISQGRPMSPWDEVRIVDDDDEDVPVGQTGHLLTRGPYTIRGYYCAGDHNRRAFTRDGFYRTGDLVRQLAGGHLVVEGRAKDQINRGGDKVAAEEVENHLLAHPSVHDAALVAMPDAFLGEKSCAFVIAREASVRAVDLQRFLRSRGLADYKIPDRIEFVGQFPTTGVGKVNKRELREHIARRLGTR